MSRILLGLFALLELINVGVAISILFISSTPNCADQEQQSDTPNEICSRPPSRPPLGSGLWAVPLVVLILFCSLLRRRSQVYFLKVFFSEIVKIISKKQSKWHFTWHQFADHDRIPRCAVQ